MSVPVSALAPQYRAITLTVYGNVAPQGSKRIYARGNVHRTVNDNDGAIQAWRHDVQAAFRAVRPQDWEPLSGPLRLEVTYTVRKPASAPKRRRTYPCRRPDGDKLDRATWDALVGAGVLVDDAQIVRWSGAKVYPGEDPGSLPVPGAVIALWRVEEEN